MGKHREVGMRAATAIQFASKYTSLLAQLLITAVLARMLPPEDFGLLAIIVVFLNLFIPFADMGIGAAIIQYRDLDEDDYGALFSFSIAFAVVLALLFCAAAVPIAAFYGNEELVPLCCLSSLSILFATLNMVPNGLLLRQKRFVSIGLRLFVVTVIAGIIAVVMAFNGFGTYALVWHNIIAGVITFFWNYLTSPIRKLTLHFMFALKKVLSYSMFQFGSSMVNYFANNLPNLVLGKCFSEAALGFYDKAYKLTTYPMSGITGVVNSVVQPYMAKHQDNPDVIFSYWLKMAKALSLVGAPIAVVFFCAPYEIVHIMYGDQWDVAVPLLQCLSVSIYFQLVNSVAGVFLLSTGHANLLFRMVVATTSLTVVGLMSGLVWGSLEAVALCVSVATCLHTVPTVYYLVKRAFGKGCAMLVRFLPEVAIGLVAGVACVAATPFLPQQVVAGFACKLGVVLAVTGLGYLATRQFGYLKELISSRKA